MWAFQGRWGLGFCGRVCLLHPFLGADLPVSLPVCPTCSFARRPVLIDMSKVYRQTNLENLDQAFSVAERDLGVTRLLDPEGACQPLPLPS